MKTLQRQVSTEVGIWAVQYASPDSHAFPTRETVIPEGIAIRLFFSALYCLLYYTSHLG